MGVTMKTVLLIAGTLVVGIALGILYNAATIRTLRRKVKELRAGIDKAPTETMKRVVWVCVINGFAWVWCSYILAALDRMQIAEELSKVALVEIIVPDAVYAFKSVVENLSKNNRWPDKGDTPDGWKRGKEPPEME